VDHVLTIFTIIITAIFGLILYDPMSFKEMLADVAQGLSSAATSLSELLKLGALSLVFVPPFSFELSPLS
jgi:hypothetical protein